MWTQVTFLTAVVISILVEDGSATDGKNVSCFYLASAVALREPPDRVTPEDIDGNLCSHIVYMSAIMDFKKLKIISAIPQTDLYDNGGLGFFNRTVALKKIHPTLKVLLNMRFTPERTTNVSEVASSAVEREALIRNSIDFLERHGFDGIDLGWLPEEINNMNHLTLLLSEMREEFEKRHLIIAIWLEPEGPGLDSEVLKNIERNVDIIYVKTLNYGGPVYYTTAIVAPVNLMNRTVHMYLEKGLDKRKMSVMILSFPFTFKLKNRKNNGIGAEIRSLSDSSPYYELVRRFRDQSEGWVLHREESSNQPWAVSNDTWISYEDPSSIRTKAEFVLQAGLGGAGLFSLDMDDFRGEADNSIGRFTLTRTLHQVLNRK